MDRKVSTCRQMWNKFPEIYLTVEENHGKISTRKLTGPGVEPGPTVSEATKIPTCGLLSKRIVTCYIYESPGLKLKLRERFVS